MLEAYTSNLMLFENIPESPNVVNVASTGTWLQLAKGHYKIAQNKLKYWLPNLHLTECEKNLSAELFRDDQNRLKEFLGYTDNLDKILGNENSKTWLKPIVCETD